MARAFQWTDDAITTAKRLFAEGHSASKIANEIGCSSRNAVIGKLSRLGIARGLAPRAEPSPLPSAPPREHTKPGFRVAKQQAQKSAAAQRALESSPAHQTKTFHPRNVAAKSDSDRREHFQRVADKALGKFEATLVASAEPVRFLERSAFQCAMPQAGWDDAPVTEKMVCGKPVQIGTSWCPACLNVVSAPSNLAAYKHRRMVGGIAA